MADKDIRRQIYELQDKIKEVNKVISNTERQKEALSKKLDKYNEEFEIVANTFNNTQPGSLEHNIAGSRGSELVDLTEKLEEQINQLDEHINNTLKAQRDNLRIELDELKKAKVKADKQDRETAKELERLTKDFEKEKEKKEKEKVKAAIDEEKRKQKEQEKKEKEQEKKEKENKKLAEKALKEQEKREKEEAKEQEKREKEEAKEQERQEKEEAKEKAAQEKEEAKNKEAELKKNKGDFDFLNKTSGGKLGVLDTLTGGKISGMAASGSLGKVAGIVSKFLPVLLVVTAVVGVISKTVKLLFNTVKKNLPTVSKSVTSRNRLEGKNVNEQRTKGIQLIEKIKAALDSIGEFLAGKLLDFLGAISEGFYYVKDFFTHLGDYALAFLKDLPQAIYNHFVWPINLIIDAFNGILWILDQLLQLVGTDGIEFRIPKIEYAELSHVQEEISKASERIAKEHADSNGLDNALDTVSQTKLQQILTDLASAVKDLGLTLNDAKTFANRVVNQAAQLVNNGMYDNLEDAANALKDAIINENYSGLSGMGINDKNVLAMMTKLYPDYDYSGNTVYTESAMAGMREEALERLVGLSSEQLSALTEEGTILSNIEQGLVESLFGKETISGVNASSGTYKNGKFVLETDDEVQNEIKSVNNYLGKILDKIPGRSYGTDKGTNTTYTKTAKEKIEKAAKIAKTKEGLEHKKEIEDRITNGKHIAIRKGENDPETLGKDVTQNTKKKPSAQDKKDVKNGVMDLLLMYNPITAPLGWIKGAYDSTAVWARKNKNKNTEARYVDDNIKITNNNGSILNTAKDAVYGPLSNLWKLPEYSKNLQNYTLNKVTGKNEENSKMSNVDKALYTFAPSIYGIKQGIDSMSRLMDYDSKNKSAQINNKQSIDVKVTVSDNRTSATASYNRNVNNAMSSANTSRATSTRRR